MHRLTVEDIEAIALGAGILGTGGGGNPYLGAVYLRREFERFGRPCQILQPEDVSDEALVCALGGMGAPTVGIEKLPSGDEIVNTFRALEKHLNRKFDAICIAEIGGANALTPLIAGLQLNLPVVDGDSMGRAFPELQMDTFSIGGVSPSPMALGDMHGNVVIFDPIDTPKRAEAYARVMTVEMGARGLLVMPVMSGAEMKRHNISGTLSLAQRIGTALLVEIDFQNENLIARRNGEVLCAVPDLITLVSMKNGESIGTEMLRYGLRVAVLVMPAPKQLKTKAALAVVGPQAFGYDVAYTPLEGNLLDE